MCVWLSAASRPRDHEGYRGHQDSRSRHGVRTRHDRASKARCTGPSTCQSTS
ncbi:Hypothetical protein A7982_07964 [Minicystis rosea]|nr:Hypothetical protein A7982_07964 [Minicystis rosea]